jgi:hypothetical protein
MMKPAWRADDLAGFIGVFFARPRGMTAVHPRPVAAWARA